MNLGQTMITLGMFILLVMSVISANRMLMENSTAQLQAQAYTASSMIASDLFSEIMNKPYDWGVRDASSFTVYNDSVHHFIDTLWAQEATGVLDSTHFTVYRDTVHWGAWGARRVLGVYLPDITSATSDYRSKKAFKDIDDYDGYSRTATYNNISGFTAAVAVYYVNSTSPDAIDLSHRRNFKKITIVIQHPEYLSSPDTLTALASY